MTDDNPNTTSTELDEDNCEATPGPVADYPKVTFPLGIIPWGTLPSNK
jgi:hypothetical protein